jgi:hypothetical protein
MLRSPPSKHSRPSGTHRHNAGARRSSFPRRVRIHFAAACALTYGLEFWLHHAVEASGQSHNVLTQSLFGLSTFYHRLVTASPRKPSPRFTTLITLSEKTSPPGVSLLNVCQERRFLGEALKSLSHAQPMVVVIDKYFGAATCPKDDPGTLNLLQGVQGVQALCAGHTGVVVGRKVSDDALTEGATIRIYPLDQSLAFAPAATCVTEGVLNIDLDLRRAALWWPNVQPVSSSQGPPPSLALAASLAYSPAFMTNGRLMGWTPESPRPYVSFVERGQFVSHNVAARDIVCAAGGDPGWRECQDDELSQHVRGLVRGRVVILGEDFTDVDRHDTVVGDLPGYILQANYIESLLDDRLIRPVPELLNVLAGLMFFGAFEYVAWEYHRRRLNALKWIVILVAGTGLIIYLSVTLFGYYLNPATIGLLAVLLRLADMALVPSREPHTGSIRK